MRTLLAAAAGPRSARADRLWSSTPPRRHGRRIALTAVLASVVAVGVVACTDDTPAAAPVPRTTVELAWTAAMEPVSGVTMAGDTAVVYATTPDGLTLNGLDPTTGAIRWTQAAAPLVAGEGLHVTVLDDGASIAYYRPDSRSRQARLVLADPATGTDRVQSEPRWWSGWPGTCADGLTGACSYTGVQLDTGAWDSRLVRMDPGSGLVSPVVPADGAAPTDLRALDEDHGLYFSARGGESATDPTRLTRLAGGGPLWERPLPEIFGSAVVSATRWSSDAVADDDDLRAVTVRAFPTDEPTGRVTQWASQISTAVIDLRDGSTRWQATGASLHCGDQDDYLPKPPKGDLLLCRYTGSTTSVPDDGHGRIEVPDGLSVTVERVDAATGTPRWSTVVGDAPALVEGSRPDQALSPVDDTRVVIPTGDGYRVLDTATGELTPAAADGQFWCVVSDPFPLDDPHYWVTSPITELRRDGVVRRCGADGSALPDDRGVSAVPDAVAATAPGSSSNEEFRIVSEPGAVRGYLVPPPPAAAAASVSESTGDTSAASSSAPPDEWDGVETAETDPWPSAVAEAWSTSEIRPVSPVVMVEGTAVYYGLVHSDLFLVGLDPETGAERWRRATTTGGLYANATVAVEQINGKIIALLPATDPVRSVADIGLSLIDPATGNDVVTTETRRWRTRPSACPGDSSKICATALIGSAGPATTEDLVVDPATGVISAAAAATGDDRYTEIYQELVQVNDHSVPTVGILRDDQLVWSSPLTDVMGGPASFDGITPRGSAIDVFLLTTEAQPDNSGEGTGDADVSRLDLASGLGTVGIDKATGQVKWRERGTSLSCRGGLIRLGRIQLPGSEFATMRCRYTGTLRTDADEHVTTDQLSVVLERFEAETGHTVWSLPVGDQPALASSYDGEDPEVPLLDDSRIAVGGQVIDLDDGRTTPSDSLTAFWCPGPDTFDQSVSYNASDQGTVVRRDRASYGLASLCTATGEPIETDDRAGTTAPPMPTAVPLAYSTPTKTGLRIVSFEDRVVAYEVPR